MKIGKLSDHTKALKIKHLGGSFYNGITYVGLVHVVWMWELWVYGTRRLRVQIKTILRKSDQKSSKVKTKTNIARHKKPASV